MSPSNGWSLPMFGLVTVNWRCRIALDTAALPALRCIARIAPTDAGTAFGGCSAVRAYSSSTSSRCREWGCLTWLLVQVGCEGTTASSTARASPNDSFDKFARCHLTQSAEAGPAAVAVLKRRVRQLAVCRRHAGAALRGLSGLHTAAIDVFDPRVFAGGIPHGAFRRLRDS